MTNADWIKDVPVAHRGYHDLNKHVWENTLTAFSRAVEAGFAIECDLHYASDGVPVIFHDEELQRLCNLTGDIRERTSRELGLIAVGGTGDKIPTLSQLLDLVQGKVPLVLELKGREADDEGFAESVLEVLEGYQGKVALMSFDHWLLRDLKALGSPYPVGLTANGNTPEELATHAEAMAIGLDFISFYYGDLPNAFITGEREKSIPVITWTVRDEEARRRTFENADQMTFEGFDPRVAV
ncbi:glycerophosphodiester phosphodiesterase [Rhizobium lentis]|uniref:Glycerophosphodiester phosphodiesterase n=1 Tax=Rhizobium lentis TaxID=1138194 RepID=A0A9Q3M3Y7_9HYPH|nr:glycerophosphodiester phosphodiesterase [Rhizobium lentis]MBX4954072.1 glycerophosphodiester phosphodiesterase [Rhizobium lentis]MBX4972403.1 glycerophosphodiester phosphodiesterase [Rhizobium lentis]MBX4984086.1 glycerophosphodiester phosphodiesterase [Rhizobium lentis]MBX5002892.1 glycerophosphodiester phosphodiesterase [Rhizobium lentis]MBX5010781.1 glycerophosphodiester phosphodiesterase [Rhizobium lentis]